MHHPPRSQDVVKGHRYRARNHGTTRNSKGYLSRRTHVRMKARKRRSSRSWYLSPEPQIESAPQSAVSLRTPAQRLVHQDITTSKRLCHGAYVGSETRNIEFKLGRGSFFSRKFVNHILKYGCAFLNGEGGSLVFGVNDNGIVCGLHVSHRIEDEARKKVDFAMLLIKPTVFPFSYSLRFLPVLKPGKQTSDLKVVCLTFKAPSASSEPILYSRDKGMVFLRREASVQGPLHLSLIIEWYRQKFPHLLNHRLCRALSRGPPFVDHRNMMTRIMELRNKKPFSTGSEKK